MKKQSIWAITIHTVRRIIDMMHYIKPWWPLYLIGVIAMVFQNLAFNLFFSSFTRDVLAAGLGQSGNNIGHLIIMYFSILAGAMVWLIPSFYALDYAMGKGSRLMQHRLFEHIQRLPVQAIEDSHTGDYIARINSDVPVAFMLYAWTFLNLVSMLVTGIGGIIVICAVEWRMALVSVATGFIGLIVNVVFAKPTKKVADELQKTTGTATEKMTDMIAGASVARVFGIRNRILMRYVEALDRMFRCGMKQVWFDTARSTLDGGIAGSINLGGRFVLGLYLVSINAITLPEMAFCINMGYGIGYMISGMGQMLTEMQKAVAAADRMMAVLKREQESYREEQTTPPKFDPNAPAVVIEGASFAYRRLVKPDVDENDPEADKLPDFVEDANMPTVINNLSMRVNRKERVALVGESGCGKTTVLKLLMSFYPLAEGNVTIQGVPLERMRLEDQRAMMAYVPQDSFLFEGSIADNIAYGSVQVGQLGEMISQEMIEAAAKAAYAHDFIISLPEGYQTLVGERGVKLSGGQRQRIAIARALLRDAPVLLLDEATSALDSESEAVVQQALDRLMEDRTTIVVAHRLSTVRDANRILVLDNGSVVEEGDHETLLKMGGRYAKMVEMGSLDLVS